MTVSRKANVEYVEKKYETVNHISGSRKLRQEKYKIRQDRVGKVIEI